MPFGAYDRTSHGPKRISEKENLKIVLGMSI
jgi:hypothetical protein